MMDITRRQLFLILSAAAMSDAEPEATYNPRAHWWGMLIDVDKCIGCGNCVRACAAENGVPEGF